MPATSSRFSVPESFINPKSITPEMEAALEVMRKLDRGQRNSVYSQVQTDGGEDYARRHGLKPMFLTERNLGGLMKGLPTAYVESLASAFGWNAERSHGRGGRVMSEREKLSRAKECRQQLIIRLASRYRWTDHGQLFAKDGQPYVLIGQPYQVLPEDMIEIAQISQWWNLHAEITNGSWYYPTGTTLVELFRCKG